MTPDTDLELVHSRDYVVRGYRKDADHLLIRGWVKDTLPGRLYTDDDDDPLVMHHMIVELTVDLPELVIRDVDVEFAEHPHVACPEIIGHYRNLVGLSIARGFTHKVRELFGGPRGCTHTTALLQAMAPVAMQCKLASRVMGREPAASNGQSMFSPEMRQLRAAGNRNTCHVWAEDGEHLQRIVAGEEMVVPIPIAKRLRAQGKDPADWRRER